MPSRTRSSRSEKPSRWFRSRFLNFNQYAHWNYDGDLIGTLVMAALLFAMSAATHEASIIAAVTGALAGLVVGLLLTRVRRP